MLRINKPFKKAITELNINHKNTIKTNYSHMILVQHFKTSSILYMGIIQATESKF
jgi:hypothetical protein